MERSISADRRTRRKQPYPLRIIQDPFVLTEALERDAVDEYCNTHLRSFDNHVCGRCSREFFTMPAFIVHKRYCSNEWPVLFAGEVIDQGNKIDSEDSFDTRHDIDSEDTIDTSPDQERIINDVEEPTPTALDLCVHTPKENGIQAEECAVIQESISPDGVAQIQSTLRSLQGQQMMQLQLIKQIYGQLISGTNVVDDQNFKSVKFGSRFGSSDYHSIESMDLSRTRRFSNGAFGILSPPNSSNETSPEDRRPPTLEPNPDPTKSGDVSAFDQLKSQVINSLKEMEQSVAQQIQEQRKADCYLDKLYRHRCHFCGKIMTSESSLQIHIRSHTGERPYACSYCDSKFSTKGNLKVHMDVHREEAHLSRLHQFGIQHGRGMYSGLQASENSPHESKYPQLVREDDVEFSTRHRSMSLPCLDRTGGDYLDRIVGINGDFRDDTNIRYSSRRQELDKGPIQDSCSDQSLIADAAIDLRVNSSTVNRSSSFPGASFLSNSIASLPALAGLYSSLLPSTPSSADQDSTAGVTQLTSSFFTHPRDSDFFKSGDLNGDKGSVAPNTLLPAPVSLSPSTCADLDDDWESMMEITTTDESEKIKSLVGDQEAKITDPNQCLICHRILSCKSALQMHYRTHTGERPFKCKICSRAFTTKGNLKTHMGVHRTKPPFRLFHQCPICHRRFNNGVVLQQHLRVHAGQAPDLSLESVQAKEVKEAKKSTDTVFDLGRSFNMSSLQPPSIHGNVSYLSPSTAGSAESTTRPSPSSEKMANPSTSVHSSNLSMEHRTRSPSLEKNAPGQQERKFPTFSPFSTPSLDVFRSQAGAAAAFNSWLSRFSQPRFPLASFTTSPSTIQSPSLVTSSRASSTTDRSIHPPPPSLSLPPTSPFGPVMLPNPQQASMFGRPNTTCNICFKTFACNSALEIHYRSHTKERPFKCTVCGRGFSTKGNMKQHLLTHKIRDTAAGEMVSSSHSDDSRSNPTSRGGGSAEIMTHQEYVNSNPQSAGTPIQQGEDQSIDFSNNANRDHSQSVTPSEGKVSPMPARIWKEHRQNGGTNAVGGSQQQNNGGPTPLESIRSMWARTESLASAPSSSASSATRKPPVLSKHQCQVCYKHFSSSSALAIHMRTHTGERPFVCVACGRSFTTKGNLKVHMGTHSWQHGQSRRGRRIFDSQHGQSIGLDGSNSYDRSSTATSMEDTSNASNPNSDHGCPNGSSPMADGRVGERKARPTFTSRTSTPSHSETASTSMLSPNSFIASTSSTSPAYSSTISSFPQSKTNGSNIVPFFSTSSVFPTPISPSSSFPFMNTFHQLGPTAMPYSSALVNTSTSMIPNYGDGHGRGDPMHTMLWMWRNVCSVCRHVCSSVAELEDHLKLHLINESGNEKMATGIPT